MRLVQGNEIVEDGETIRVARDGQTIRVPVMLMDGKSIPAAPMVGHKPGYAAASDAECATLDVVREARNRRLTDAWKSPPPIEPALVATQTAPAASAVTTNDQRYTARDKRLEDAWRSA